MSQGRACRCLPREVMVTQRNSRCSAFDGYRHMSSDYSCVRCIHCGQSWRTKAKYVDRSPNAPAGWVRTGDPREWRRMLKMKGRSTENRVLDYLADVANDSHTGVTRATNLPTREVGRALRRLRRQGLVGTTLTGEGFTRFYAVKGE